MLKVTNRAHNRFFSLINFFSISVKVYLARAKHGKSIDLDKSNLSS